MDLYLASCKTLPEPDLDAAPLAAALAAAGVEAEVRAWDDPQVDWSAARMTVLRSTWNYPHHSREFLAWTEKTSRQTRLWNPVEAIRWNVHKRYLLDLADRGVNTTPTSLIEKGAHAEIRSIVDQRNWDQVVVKPAISAASYRTMLVDHHNMEAAEAHLHNLLRDHDVLVQPYIRSVEDYGERALVWIDGELTHAVRKNPRFEGQDESVSDMMPINADEAKLALRAIQAVGHDLLYARVDVAPAPNGIPMLMELELIEPSLFFPQHPAALDRFVAAIVRRLEASA